MCAAVDRLLPEVIHFPMPVVVSSVPHSPLPIETVAHIFPQQLNTDTRVHVSAYQLEHPNTVIIINHVRASGLIMDRNIQNHAVNTRMVHCAAICSPCVLDE